MNQSTFLRTALTTAVLLALPVGAMAQSTGRLYDAMPPQNSSYVRVITAAGTPVDVLVDGKVRVRNLAVKTASPYLIVPKGTHHIQLSSKGKSLGGLSVNTAAQGAYTLAFPTTSAKPYLFADRTGTNKLKSILAVYNMAPGAGGVTVSASNNDGGAMVVFANLAAGRPATIEVNPIQVKLNLIGKGSPTARASTSLDMSPGAAYSVFVFPNGARGISAKSTQNTIERYLGK